MRATRALRALLGGLALLAVLATPASARADAVTDWNQVAAAALQSPGTAHAPGRRPGGCLDRAPGDGPRRRLRRGQRDRRLPRAVRLLARGQALVLAGRRRRGRGASRARQRRARDPRRPHARDRGRLPGDAPADPGRAGEGRRDRHRRSRRDRAARGARRGRSLRAVPLLGVDPAGRLAAGAAGDGDRPGGLAEGRHTVRAPRPRSLPRPAHPTASARGRTRPTSTR